MNTAQHERLQGYQSVMKEARLEPIPWESLVPRPERAIEGLEATRELLTDKAGKGVSAILAATDSTAMGVLRALHDAGRRIPEDMALMGFGGASTAEYMHPPLSTVTLPMRTLGEQAARTLLDRIEGADGPARHVLLPTELTVRASCGAKS